MTKLYRMHTLLKSNNVTYGMIIKWINWPETFHRGMISIFMYFRVNILKKYWFSSNIFLIQHINNPKNI